MHEWALADGILHTAIEFAEKKGGKKIDRIVVVLGELQDVESEIVEFALNEMKKGTMAEDAKIEFEEEEAIFKCRDCGHQWKLKEISSTLNKDIREDIHFVPEVVHAFLECPQCGSRDFEVLQGRGVYIKEIIFQE